MSIYVGNLSYEVTEPDLREVFSEYGNVQRVHMPRDRETGKFRGFAFVSLEAEAGEAKAIEELDEAEWMGRTLKVNKARERGERRGSGTGRGRTAYTDF